MAEVWHGSWWRPSESGKEEVGGELRIDDRGCILVLFGSFASWNYDDLTRGAVAFPLDEPLIEPLIHGYANGKMVSLLDAQCTFPRLPGALGTERWRARAAIEAHLDPGEEEPTFTGLRMHLQHLGAWARARGVQERFDVREERLEVAAKTHQLASCVLPSGAKVAIEQQVGTSHDAGAYSIRQPVSLAIEPPTAAPWLDLLNAWLQPWEVLLWVATASAGRVESLYVRPTNLSEARWCRLWVPLVRSGAEADRELWPSDLLFTADEFPRGFCRGLDRWLEIWDDLRHVVGPLFARDRAPFVYANDRFYTAAAAVEGYHRYCSESGADVATADHRARVARLDSILSAWAPDLREWAVNAARPFNHVPLWRRFADVICSAGAVGESIVGVHGETFARQVASARHGHAHALEGPRLGDESGSLYFAARALVWLLRLTLMVDLGFDLDDAASRITKHDSFRWTAEEIRGSLEQRP